MKKTGELYICERCYFAWFWDSYNRCPECGSQRIIAAEEMYIQTKSFDADEDEELD